MDKPFFTTVISEYLSEGKLLEAAMGAFIAPIIHFLYGDGRLLPIALLLSVIVLDWITGIAASHKDNTHSYEYGKLGILRTLFLLALPVLAKMLDSMLSMPGLFFYTVTLGIIYHTWESLTANAYRAGWGKWIPQSVMEHIDSELKAKAELASRRGAGIYDSSGSNGDSKNDST